jgi:hypothetical protein
MKKVAFVFCYLFMGASCALTNGKSISADDLAKFKNGSLGLGELKKRYGEPLMVMDGTNDGSFYSPKCGKKGSPVSIMQYSYSKVDHKLVSLTTQAQVIYFITKNNKICFVSASNTAQNHAW